MKQVTQVQSGIEVYPQSQMVEMADQKKIGILGGTFNPIHNGHLIMADQILNQLGLDEIWFLPDAIPPHVDTKTAITAKDRVMMVNGAIADNPRFALEMDEVIRGGVSYTYDTMVDLKRQHPHYDFYFIIGGDMVDYLPKWNRIDELLKIVKFVGVKRYGASNSSPYPIIWVDIPYINISSSLVRTKIKNRQSVRYLVPDVVLKYIKEHHLYEK